MDNSVTLLEHFLYMEDGDDDVIYDENRYGAAAAIASSKQMLTSALHSMKHTQGVHVKIADLGLGDGGHTFSTVDTVVEVLRRKLAAIYGGTEPAFEVFFSDLPSSDGFGQFENRVTDSGKKYHVAGTPVSFYWPLFPKGELHVVVTTNALQWLSHVPIKVIKKGSKTWNKGRVWIEGAEKEVVEAYAEQADDDLVTFLKYRKGEIVVGGMLFMLMAGRPSGLESQVSDDSPFKLSFTTLMNQTWQELVDEGSIEEDKRDAFNIPLYLRNTEEVAAAIERCGGFKIEKMEMLKIADPMNARQQEFMKDPDSYGRAMGNLVQAGYIKPMVKAYLGPDLTSKFYERYAIKAATNKEFLAKDYFYTMIAISAIRV
ncbi:unnamed protein product [Eruca vesicaria subsp. sativa]|uniref:Uncharacterized protein n=1 Tax=Eruca vesicaria subsp. sativa TaxID=29727 RepID=A0ABC8M640_ERUVS|nr:unnamed protein product [Eruca vesicaria subsp. sativa]